MKDLHLRSGDPLPWFKLIPRQISSRWIEPHRGGYTLTMRETVGTAECLRRLETWDTVQSGARIHVGWGSFRNLDVAAARRSAGLLLLDVNLHQLRIWETVAEVFCAKAGSTPDGFVKALAAALPERPPSRRFLPEISDWLASDLKRPGSWMNQRRPERFGHIRHLFRDGLVATACVDLMDDSPTSPVHTLAKAIACAAQSGKGMPDTLYISNLPWMLLQRDAFYGLGSPDEGIVQRRQRLQAVFSAIIMPFKHIIVAARETMRSRPANRSWRTQLLIPEALDDTFWSSVPRARGVYRSRT